MEFLAFRPRRQINRELFQLTGMKKSRTTSYHALGNRHCERYNRTLLDMLGTLKPIQKQNQIIYINPFFINMLITATKMSPYFLMFRRNRRLLIDEECGIKKTELKSTSKHITYMKKCMKVAYMSQSKRAERELKRHRKKGCMNRELKVKECVRNSVDRVSVKMVSFDMKHKISDKWEDRPSLV